MEPGNSVRSGSLPMENQVSVRPHPRVLHQCARGFGLVEVLVAVVVLSLGLLGLVQLQLTSLRSSHAAALRLEALALAGDLAEQLRAHRAEALSGGFDTR